MVASPRQRVLLATIARWVSSFGRPPTYREIGEQMGIRSTRGVYDHVAACERKGLLEREPHVPRGLKVTPRGAEEIEG